MKKSKKLNLRRETLRGLEGRAMTRVHGAYVQTQGCESFYRCDASDFCIPMSDDCTVASDQCPPLTFWTCINLTGVECL